MAVYSLGQLIEPEVNSDAMRNNAMEARTKKSTFKHGYFSRHRTGWTELDVEIIKLMAKGENNLSIAASLGMKNKYFDQILCLLRKLKKARTNAELVAIAMREGIIK